MSHSTCNISNIIPLQKSLLNPTNGCFYRNQKRNEVGLIRVRSNKNGVKAMKGEKVDNLDHLQRPAGLKRREVSSIPIFPNGLWDRYPSARTVQQMMDTMDRIIDEPTAFATRWPSQSPPPNTYAKGRTPWEIMEQETAYKIRFDMPGMTKEDVKIFVEEKMLVIKAAKAPRTKKDGEENGEDEDVWPAKSYGSYSTRIALPENVEFEKIKAQVKDGVLYLSIPKPCFKSKVFDINVD